MALWPTHRRRAREQGRRARWERARRQRERAAMVRSKVKSGPQ
jgi:hypothetical protein